MLKFLLVLCLAASTSGSTAGGRGRRDPGVPATEICLLPPDEGPCRARIPSYYYDRYTQSCRQFIYGGCEGNANNFETWAACDEACPNPEERRGEPLKFKQQAKALCTSATCESYRKKWRDAHKQTANRSQKHEQRIV